MIMPVTPRMEPTDRSMWRVTMTSTMPVAITATEAVCTDRFHRLRGVRKVPPDRMWKPIQMTASAPIMPRKRTSTSSAWRIERDCCCCGGEDAAGTPTARSLMDDPLDTTRRQATSARPLLVPELRTVAGARQLRLRAKQVPKPRANGRRGRWAPPPLAVTLSCRRRRSRPARPGRRSPSAPSRPR